MFARLLRKSVSFRLRSVSVYNFSGRLTQMDFDDQDDYNAFLKMGCRLEEGELENFDKKKLKSLAKNVEISKKLYRVQFSRSSGKGGQHVNTTDSKATIFVDINNTPHLTQEIKNNIKKRYSNYISQ